MRGGRGAPQKGYERRRSSGAGRDAWAQNTLVWRRFLTSDTDISLEWDPPPLFTLSATCSQFTYDGDGDADADDAPMPHALSCFHAY